METEGDANSSRESGDAESGEFNAARAVSALYLYIFSFEVDGPGHVTKAIRACVYVGFRDMDEGAEFLLLSPAVLMRKKPIIRQL